MADFIKIIKNDHRQVEELFKKFEDLSDRAVAKKRTVALQICEMLTTHARMEEKLLYPVFLEKFKKKGDKLVEEAAAEHEVAKHLITQIQMISPTEPQFEAKVTVLKEYITHHVKEEEKKLLPMAKKNFSKEELLQIGDNMEQFKASLSK
jgi:hemerythrin-like domain-containing protein